MRTLGLDIGEKRIGVAISDPSGRVATPLSVLDAREVAADIGAIRRIVEDYEVQRMVVGLPLTLSGDEGAQAREVRRTAEMLALRLGMAVAYQDERLTSKAAERAMSEAGADSRARRGRVDMVAAALLLQTYLDAQAAS
ncbi:MAG: Holliday junction resolvase RuvX [Coriobacteriia bacterium]|nr:Holliday junction resolvase RuvX [Coriobacteriia bacterium]